MKPKSSLNRGTRLFALLCLEAALPWHAAAQSWTNQNLSAGERATALLQAMTFDEKVAMIHGAGGPYVGNLPANARLGIPALTLNDGPAGLRLSDKSTTALPAPIAISASWDVALAREYGRVMGAEARGKGVEVLLGPMMNAARAYEAGRNFEGYGEDPDLSGAMAAATLQGVQSQGVIATAKHFVCNDQETLRTLISSDVDERTRQEIYYPPFLDCVRAGVGAVMASYNRVNDRYACELEALNATLKKQWGFNGPVMSDWGAGFSTVAGMNNGLDVEMYSAGQFQSNAVSAAIQSGNVPLSELDGMAHRILATMFQFGVFDHPPAGNLSSTVTNAAHNQFARDAAAAGTVLLKNRGGVLPLNSSVRSLAVIGSVAGVAPISTGGGSASVNLPYNVTPLAGIVSRAGGGITVSYAQGDGASLADAVQLAANSDVAIVCVGQRTSEGSDRASLALPSGQDALISAIAAANSNTITVVYSSSATLMPWANQVAAILMAWYPGQENGNALAQVLFGDVNPAAKLPVTIPAAANEVPTSTTAQFPGVNGHVSYSEGLEVGYRWYDANHVTPLFPFGHGLSYTTFGYSNLTVGAVSPSGQVRIGFDLTNTGSRSGAEVAELYLGFPEAAGEPPGVLKGFQKVFLSPGETRHVNFDLTWEDLANWDATARGWVVAPGTFEAKVGASSRDIRLTASFVANLPIPASDLANAALHQPVTVSSATSLNTAGARAVDGDPTSAWTSLASDPQWITVDLGMLKDLSRVRLVWGTNYASSYQIQASADNTNWTTIFSTNQAAGGLQDVLVSGRGRFVRVFGTQRAGPGGYALAGLEVFSQPQRPFGGIARTLPGRIQAEDYDTGGETVAYHDTTVGNEGGAYRADDVGIETTSDAGNGYDVGWINAGEWLEYTVNPPDLSAIYRVSVRAASPAGGGQLRVRFDGAVLGTIAVPNTGGWQIWQTITLPEVPLQGGTGSKALRLEAINGGFNLNWIQLDRITVCGVNNIALNRPSAASSVESASYPAANAFDGNPTTRWSSAFSDPQWVEADLGSVQELTRVRLNWENASARSYHIQFSSDHNSWTNVYTTTNGPGGLNDLAAVGSARYVRMYSTQRSTSYGNSLWEFEVYSTPPEAVISEISPAAGSVFVEPASNFTFSVSSAATIPTNGVQLILNGIDVSPELVFSGSSTNWRVRFPQLRPNLFYSATINLTNANGFGVSTTWSNAFDTFSQSNLIVEAEDFDFDGGHFIDEPAPTAWPASNSYYLQTTPAVWGVDLTTPGDISGEQFAYRTDSCGTQEAADFLRQKFIAAGASDYNVGWWYAGAWLNYTRTFPTNNYYLYGRLASDNASYSATCSLVTDGLGTSNQTTRPLGTFRGSGAGWQAWQWVPLRDPDGRLAVISLAGVQTLKMTSGDSLNANFYLLAPAPASVTLAASISNASPVVTFPTQDGFNYMVVYKNALEDAYWKLLRNISGDGTAKNVGDSSGQLRRFYRAVIQ